ncbi:MAG: energy transducer TonB [Cyclobacteriaceae bacterium]|nr:energy transducer TonB [Cyclobacteriaceae bacterium]
METKKSSKADLTKYRSLIFGLSFLITLSFIITAFEWKSYGNDSVAITESSFGVLDPLWNIPITAIPPPPKPMKVWPTVIEVAKEDDIIKDEYPQIDIGDEPTPVVFVPAPPAPEIVDSYKIFDFVESSAVPMDGFEVFYRQIADNIKYPSQARRMGVKGRVFVQFVINLDGSLTDIKVIKGIGAGCDEEAIRVLKAAPAWKPGKQRGVPVRQRMILPITFELG